MNKLTDLDLCRLVVKHFPCSCASNIDPQFDPVCGNCLSQDEALDLAKAIRSIYESDQPPDKNKI